MSKRPSSPRNANPSAKRATPAATIRLGRDTNQALGIAEYAIEFLKSAEPSAATLRRVELFHTDSVICGLSALAQKTRAPTVLTEEALEYPLGAGGATLMGDPQGRRVHPEKAVAANASAVREWDSNGTVFGYNAGVPGHTAGEFGHNDFYPVVVAACQEKNLDGKTALRAMLLVDEIRGRLCEVFSLKTYKIDHVMHGSIASCATYGALLGATAEQIESAIGMVVAHYVPWRAIRAGKQLSDSKGASAALAAELAVLSVRRSMRGFVGPRDIFRNPESLFRRFEPTERGESPFDLVLSRAGDDFSVNGMHFKLGLYEHQSAGCLHAVVSALHAAPALARADNIKGIKIVCYEPAYGIIGDPAKRDPRTRQSADHSMVFIASRLLLRARALGEDGVRAAGSIDELWRQLILTPDDYSPKAVVDPRTREVMDLITFEHGGKEYDDRYPDGIPTSMIITDGSGATHDSGLVMYPAGHARNTANDLEAILRNKFRVLGSFAVKTEDDVAPILAQLDNLADKTPEQIQSLYTFGNLDFKGKCFDDEE